QQRLETMARVFTRIDRTLSGMEVSCHVGDAPSMAPAWSDGKHITFNARAIGDVTNIDDIIKLNGLNYHELSHILYTPRAHEPFTKKILNEGLFPVFNILEDQRIETLFTGMYPGTRPYFVMTFMKYCLAEPNMLPEVFPLAWGRRYLPADLQKK